MSLSDVSKRRALAPEDLETKGMFLVSKYKERRKLLDWIATNTSGEFFLGRGYVAFADEGDVLMFKLGPYYDRERVQKAEENHPMHSFYKAGIF